MSDLLACCHPDLILVYPNPVPYAGAHFVWGSVMYGYLLYDTAYTLAFYSAVGSPSAREGALCPGPANPGLLQMSRSHTESPAWSPTQHAQSIVSRPAGRKPVTHLPGPWATPVCTPRLEHARMPPCWASPGRPARRPPAAPRGRRAPGGAG